MRANGVNSLSPMLNNFKTAKKSDVLHPEIRDAAKLVQAKWVEIEDVVAHLYSCGAQSLFAGLVLR